MEPARARVTWTWRAASRPISIDALVIVCPAERASSTEILSRFRVAALARGGCEHVRVAGQGPIPSELNPFEGMWPHVPHGVRTGWHGAGTGTQWTT